MFRVHKTRRRLILLWSAFLSPTPYGSLTSHVIQDLLYFRVLNSFVLLIHKGASWCSSLSRALMVKNLTWLSMFVLKSFCFLQRLAADVSRISQLFFLCRLWLPVNVRKHLLRIIGHSICQNCIKDSYQLTADGNHRLFLLERIVRSCRVILVQWPELRVLRYQWNCCIEQYCSQLTPTSFTYGRLSFVLSRAVLP